MTGETTKDGLECAHILPVKAGVFEVYGNSILFSVDLRYLYGGGAFEISSNGQVINLSEALREEYQRCLEGKALKNNITQRIRVHLAERSCLE